MAKQDEYIAVMITAGSAKEAKVLSRLLVAKKLAACCAVTPIRSLFTWKGKTEQAREMMLIVKTRKKLFTQIEQTVRRNHSYEVPEIIALPIIAGSAPYLRWVKENTA